MTSSPKTASATARHTASGFSMVELIVSMVLGLFIILGIIQLYTGNRSTTQLITAQTRVQETGRYATQLLAKEMRWARSTGCSSLVLDQCYISSPADDTTTPPTPATSALNVVACHLLGSGCTGASAILKDRSLGYSVNQQGGPNWLADLPGNGGTSPAGAVGEVNNHWVRGDVLVTWGVVGDGFYTSGSNLIESGTPVVKVLATADIAKTAGLDTGRLALISDCEGSDVFQITSRVAGTPTTTTLLGHDLKEAGAKGADPAANRSVAMGRAYNWPGEPLAAGPNNRARVFPFDLRVFFICCVDQRSGESMDNATSTANCRATDAGVALGDPKRYRPALCRWSASHNDTQALVTDIADLRVTYDGWRDGSPGQGDTCATKPAATHVRLSDYAGTAITDAKWINDGGYWDRVDTVRVQLLATSSDEIPARTQQPYTTSTDPQVLGGGAAQYRLPADRRSYESYGLTIATRAQSPWSR
jgi:Tfp pilus assembly protein PilV